ncbi:MAG: helix-turn-helix domain-containing protein [Bacillota bacterium]|jgi:transcriptional regulator with XRE-family HTH domain
MDSVILGHRIRQHREKKGFTQEQIADILGISRQAYIRLEKGAREVTFIEIKKIADYLGIHYSLITNVDDDESLSLKALCRDEFCTPDAERAFEIAENILDVFSAQERLYFRMKEKKGVLSRG